MSVQRKTGGLRMLVTLGGLSMVSGFLVATTYQLTLKPIQENRREALEKAVFTVLPAATVRRNFVLEESGLRELPEDQIAGANLYAGYSDAGDLVGVAIEGSARGYQDVVKVLYGYSLEGENIVGITVLQSSETPGLGDRVQSDPDFLANFEALDARLNSEGTAMANDIVTVKHGDKTEPWQIDAISGATITSKAIGEALRSSTESMLPLLNRYKSALAQERTVK